MRVLRRLANWVRALIPILLYLMWGPVRRELAFGPSAVLDVGCHEGDSMKLLRRRGGFRAIGVDIYDPALRVAQQRGTHDALIRADARKLPFAACSVDAIICMETLEHVDKEDGLLMLQDFERIAARKIILSTPVGYLPTFESPAFDGNPHQYHRSGWSPEELRALGYRVYVGAFHRARLTLTRRGTTLTWLLNIAMNTLLAPLTWFSPHFGSGMLCVKDLDGRSLLRSHQG